MITNIQLLLKTIFFAERLACTFSRMRKGKNIFGTKWAVSEKKLESINIIY
jgi:hypothetical protein